MEFEEVFIGLIKYIKVEYLILIPTIFGIGKVIKHTKRISDDNIPIVLMIIGILFSLALGGVNIHSVIQGIIACIATVWGNEAVTQLVKK